MIEELWLENSRDYEAGGVLEPTSQKSHQRKRASKRTYHYNGSCICYATAPTYICGLGETWKNANCTTPPRPRSLPLSHSQRRAESANFTTPPLPLPVQLTSTSSISFRFVVFRWDAVKRLANTYRAEQMFTFSQHWLVGCYSLFWWSYNGKKKPPGRTCRSAWIIEMRR